MNIQNYSSQLFSSIASAPISPGYPTSINNTHVTLYSKKSRDTVSGTLFYSSETEHRCYPAGGTLIPICFYRKTSVARSMVFVQTSSRGEYFNPICAINL